MFVITNRVIHESQSGLNKLGPTPNPAGPNELRLVEATRQRGRWHIEVLPDYVDAERKREIGASRRRRVLASEYAAYKQIARLRKTHRNLLFFVHGFNNDIEAVLERSRQFARAYNVEVLAFSWPANGGGIRGAASYLSDKRDARASVGALDRCLAKIFGYLQKIRGKPAKAIAAEANRRFPGDAERRNAYIATRLQRDCPFTVNMVLHSMGNYLYKQVLASSVYRGRLLLFDNIVLAAADANNAGHGAWVDRIRARRRVYITINEDDQALILSRLKLGEEQRARLGHYPHNLESRQAAYIDFTGARGVKRSHAYFEGAPLRNRAVKRFFTRAFNGDRAESGLGFDPATDLYRIASSR
ncbi:MAG: alpha/beta hydrolase [Phycisphaerae bacterium]